MRSKLWSTTSSQLSCKSHSRKQRPKTLRKHHRDELDTGQVKASAKVAESLFRKAVGDGLCQFSARAPIREASLLIIDSLAKKRRRLATSEPSLKDLALEESRTELR